MGQHPAPELEREPQPEPEFELEPNNDVGARSLFLAHNRRSRGSLFRRAPQALPPLIKKPKANYAPGCSRGRCAGTVVVAASAVIN